MGSKDKAAKILCDDVERFAAIFNGMLFQDCPISAKEIKNDNSVELAMIELKSTLLEPLEKNRDVVKFLSNGSMMVILGIENQSEINYQMPLRILGYDFLNYQRQANEKWKEHCKKIKKDGKKISGKEYIGKFCKGDKLKPVITIVLYTGDEPWDGPTSLKEMLEPLPVGMNKYVSDYKIHILDVKHMDEEKLENFTGEIKAAFGFLRYSNDTDKLLEFMHANEDQFKNISAEVSIALAELSNSKELLKSAQIQESYDEGGNVDMCKAIDGIKQKGIQLGREEGRAEGRAEGREEGRAEGREEGIQLGREKGIQLGIEKEKLNLIKKMRRSGISETKIEEILNA